MIPQLVDDPLVAPFNTEHGVSEGDHRVVEVGKIEERTAQGECPVPRPLLYLPGPGK
ncbi:MAG: hypothetical protein N2C14_20535 [Planctomycetales bacterium]